jgi:hypothetical protein
MDDSKKSPIPNWEKGELSLGCASKRSGQQRDKSMAMKELVRLLDIKRQDFEQACNDELGCDKYLIFQSGRQESGISASHNDRDGTKSIFGVAQHAFYFENHALGSSELHRVLRSIAKWDRRPFRVDQRQAGSIIVHRLEPHLQAGSDVAADEYARGEDHIIGDASAAVDDEDMLIRKKRVSATGGGYAISSQGLGCAVEYFNWEWSGVGEFDVEARDFQIADMPISVSARGGNNVLYSVFSNQFL